MKSIPVALLLMVIYSVDSKLLQVSFGEESKANFEILLNGIPWFKEDLSLGRISVTSDGQTLSTVDQSLEVESSEPSFKGTDVLGSFSCSHLLHWRPLEIGFETQLRVYDDEDVAVFTQRFQVIEMCLS